MRKRYGAAFKAQIVQEFLREEKTITQIASAHGVHPNLIGEWKAAVLKELPMIFEKQNSELEQCEWRRGNSLTNSTPRSDA